MRRSISFASAAFGCMDLASGTAQVHMPTNLIPYTDSTFGINNASDYDGIQSVWHDMNGRRIGIKPLSHNR